MDDRLPRSIKPIVINEPDYINQSFVIIFDIILKKPVFLSKYNFVFNTYIQYKSNFISNKKTIQSIYKIFDFFMSYVKSKRKVEIIKKGIEQLKKYEAIREKYKNFKRNPKRFDIKYENYKKYLGG